MHHEVKCPLNGTSYEHTDLAKRLSDEYRLHRLADPIGSIGHWIAVHMGTGKSDHTLYDTRRDAVTHQGHNEQFYTYVQIVPSDMNQCQAESYIQGQRKLAQAGISLIDRDHRTGGRVMIPRLTVEDQQAQMRSSL